MVEFYINGKRHSLSKPQVEVAVRDLEPEVIQSLAVQVNGTWWPAKQPFVAALGLRNTDVNSRTALRNLEHVGFAVHDTATQGPLPDDRAQSAPSGPEELRRVALSLAVELLSGQTRDAKEAVVVADELLKWLTGPSIAS